MKKIKKKKFFLPLFVALVAVIGFSYGAFIPKAYSVDYNEQILHLYKNNMWYLGKNLSVGDSFTYKICDPLAIANYSAESYHYFTKDWDHNSSLCYVAKLDFVNLLISGANQVDSDVWIVQATIHDVTDGNNDNDNDDMRHSVFHVNPQNYDVRPASTIHPDSIRYTQSLRDTIFSIFKYADEPKLLKTGSKWGPVTEYLEFDSNPHMMVLDESLEYLAMQNFANNDGSSMPIYSVEKSFSKIFEIGYEIDIIDSDNDVTTSFLVSSEIPFPLSGVKYSPVHITKPFKTFEFELLSFVLQNNEKTVDDLIMPQDFLFDGLSGDDVTDSMNNNHANEDNIEEQDNALVNDEITPDNDDHNNNNNHTIDKSDVKDIATSNYDVTESLVVSDNNPTQDDISDVVENTVIPEPTNESKTTDDKSDYLPYVVAFILMILIVLFVSLKAKKIMFMYPFSLKNRSLLQKNLSSNNRKSFSKMIHFKDKVTIRISKKNSDFGMEE